MVRPRSSRRSSRARQRGAAVFVVVMVVTMLAAVGVFAVRQASLAVATTGYTRSLTQNQFAAEYAAMAAVSDWSAGRTLTSYVGAATISATTPPTSTSDTCLTNAGYTYSADGGGPTCVHVTLGEIAGRVQTAYPGRVLFEVPDAGGTGSLSYTPQTVTTNQRPLEGTFDVEVIDTAESTPVPGQQNNQLPGSPTKVFKTVVIAAHGGVRPALGNITCADPTAQTTSLLAGNATERIIATVGPVDGVVQQTSP